MGIFQSTPKTAEELEHSKPLSIAPEEVAEMDEREWYERAYRGANTPQLTVRAVLMGSILGFFLAFTNLYVGLKTGWTLAVALTACILSYSIWQGLSRAGLVRGQMTILENNCMQSAASSAGFSTGVLAFTAFPALLILSATPENPQGVQLPWTLMSLWIISVAALGVVMAVPMKRSLINRERLKFPSGIAAASTLQSLYASGSEAVQKSRVLMWSALVAGLFPLGIDLNLIASGPKLREPVLPSSSKIFDWIPALGQQLDASGAVVSTKLSDWTVVLDHNPVMFGAGALVGIRVAASMLLAGLVLVFVVGPMGLDAEWTAPSGQLLTAVSKPGKAWKEIGLWFGAPLMVSSSLMGIALQWRIFVRAFSGLGQAKEADPQQSIRRSAEVPMSWMGIGLSVSGAAVVSLAALHFDVPVYLGIVAVLLTFVLALVAARATGESDITPMGAMGKITQLTYGVLIPQSATANLMTAGITAGAAMSCADLLGDLRSGYLLGADPRRQFLAQLSGIFGGTAATVIGYHLLVPDATALLGTADTPPQFPAPAAQAWRAVAELFRDGISNLHPVHRDAIMLGLAIGVLFTLLEATGPKVKKWMPSATGLGLGFILPFQYPLAMFLGAFAAELWKKRNPANAKKYLVLVAAGIVAGVSVVGVIVAGINNFVLR